MSIQYIKSKRVEGSNGLSNGSTDIVNGIDATVSPSQELTALDHKNEHKKEIIKFYSMSDISLTEKRIPESYHAHWHDAAEFTVFFKEGASYKIGNTVYEPGEGDILLIWPRELHTIEHMPKSGGFFIQFSSSIIESNHDLVSASLFMNSLHLISATQNRELADAVWQKLYEIRDLFLSDSYFSETRCKRCIYEILLLIGNHVITEKLDAPAGREYSDASFEYIRSACRYIATHSSEDISESGVAHTMGLSSSYFSKLFKKYTQKSFPMYLSEIRVLNAIHLLTKESLSVTECAFQAGFQSITTFNKVFHDNTGYSPRDYRKLHSS
ncbi:MAG: helix-turn-helix transcriptional regulator [Lachnospiraceae bacterium]|nr:helix-turn-helix transcriptional regulator [Lachnospiraceae bacterium]